MLFLILLVLSAAHFSAATIPAKSPSKSPTPQFSATLTTAISAAPAKPPVPFFSAANPTESGPPVSCYSGTAPAPADPPHFSADFESLTAPTVRHSPAAAKLAGVGSPANPPVPHPPTSSNPSVGSFRAVDLSAASNPAVFLCTPPSTLPEEIWENILLRLGPADQFFGQFVCKQWKSTVSPNIVGFRNHVLQINSVESRKAIHELENLLRLLSRTRSNLEEYNRHPVTRPHHVQLVERFLSEHPEIVPKEWDFDKMERLYIDQIKFKVPVPFSDDKSVQQDWLEYDFRFKLEGIERKIMKEIAWKQDLFLMFVVVLALYFFWPAWAEKKDTDGSKGKGKKDRKNGKKGGKGKRDKKGPRKG